MRTVDAIRWCRNSLRACAPWLLALLLCPVPARAEDQTLILQRLRQQQRCLLTLEFDQRHPSFVARGLDPEHQGMVQHKR